MNSTAMSKRDSTPSQVEGILFDNNVNKLKAIAFCKKHSRRYIVTPMVVGENGQTELCRKILNKSVKVQILFLENERFQQEKIDSINDQHDNLAIIQDRWRQCNSYFGECAEGFKRLMSDPRTKPALRSSEGIETLLSLASSSEHKERHLLNINLLRILRIVFPIKSQDDNLGIRARRFWNDLTGDKPNKRRAVFYDSEYIRYATTLPRITLCSKDFLLAEVAKQLGLLTLHHSQLGE